jgi:hypothetical protein
VAAIPDDLLVRALCDWSSTLGDANDSRLMRRLAPRTLRLMATDALHVYDALVADKLIQAHWRDWAPAERAAVDEFCEAWWLACLAGADTSIAFTALDFLVSMTAGVDRWLARWAATRSESADLLLLDVLSRWREELLAGDLSLPSYSLPSRNIAPAVTGFLLDQIPRRIPHGVTADDAEILGRLALIAKR